MGVLDSAINEIHLSVATEVQKYPLGFIYSAFDGGNNPSVNRYIYVKAVSVAIDRGDIYAVSRSTSADFTATVASADDINVLYGVGMYSIAIGSYGFMQIQGNVSAVKVAGATTIAHALKATVGAETATDEGSATLSASSIGVATSTSASYVTAFLFGKNIQSASGAASLGSLWRLRPDGTTMYLEYSTDNFATVAWANAWVAE